MIIWHLVELQAVNDFLPEPSKGWQREKGGKLREKN